MTHFFQNFCVFQLNYKIKKSWENSLVYDSVPEVANNPIMLSDQDDDSNSSNLQIDTDRETDEDSPKIEILDQVIIKEKREKKTYKKFTQPAHIQVRAKKSADNKVENVYYCKICDREFKTKQQRYYHLFCESEKPFKCSFKDCNKSFTTESLKKDHETAHSTENLFHCNKCEKSFKRKSSLRKHEYFHVGKCKYECADCQKQFVDKVKYEAHQNIHKKLLPYQCSICKKSFAAKNYLQKHQVLHSNETKYRCSKCDQKFKWLTSLTLHVTTAHNENKEYFKCKECLKNFLTKRGLERHEKIHSNIKYRCILCEGVQSNRKDNLMRHVRHLHNDVESSKVSNYIETVLGDGNELDIDHEKEGFTETDKDEDIDFQEDDDIIEVTEVSLSATENISKTATSTKVTENLVQNKSEKPSVKSVSSEEILVNPARYAFIAPDEIPVEMSNNVVTPTAESIKPSEILETENNPDEPPVINNRVNVICSVGRPLHPIEGVVKRIDSDPPQLKPTEIPVNDDVIIIEQPQPSKIQLPPKKKATLCQKSTPRKPKYDAIEHYKKMLLLSGDDENHEESLNVEDTEDTHEPEVPPIKGFNLIHWRKLTSQNWGKS